MESSYRHVVRTQSAPPPTARLEHSFNAAARPCITRQLTLFKPTLGCGNGFRIHGSYDTADIKSAIAKWSEALSSSAILGVPNISWTDNPESANVTIVANGPTGGQAACGQVIVDPDSTVRVIIGGSCTNPDVLADLLVHEFGHMIGFQGQSSHGLGQPGVSDNCASFLPPAGEGVNSEVCQHDIEYIYEAYNQREGGFTQTAFWDHPIVTGLLTTPSSIDIDQGESIPFTVDSLVFGRSPTQAVDVGTTPLFFRTDPVGLADLAEIANGTLIGKNAGPGDLVIDVGSVPSAYLQGTELFVNDHRVPLVVKDTTPVCDPGNPPLRVTAISADQEPAITLVGSHSFGATHVGCPDGPMWFDWTFDPSYLGAPTTTIDSAGANVSYLVVGGNYTVTVAALPSDSTGPGFPLIRYVNVCTNPPGGGPLLLQEDEGVGTNAAGGCGGGGGEPF